MKYIMALMIDKYLAWLLVRGRGVTTFFLAPTPHEKPNENLIQTRVSSEFSAGVGGENIFSIFVHPTPTEKLNETLVWMRFSFGCS